MAHPADNALDRAFAAFKQWRFRTAIIDPLFSETDTRCKLIDSLLIDILGWSEEHIRREVRYTDDDGRHAIDYLLSLTTPSMIVEAKRSGLRFEIPDTAFQWYSLNGVVTRWPNAWSAIVQAREYADQVGARYALVTNGHQYIAFKALTERSRWTNGRAYVIRTPTELEEHFTEFWTFFAKTQIDADRFAQHDLSSTVGRPRSRPRDAVVFQNTGHRNAMAHVLHRVFAPILLDLPNPTDTFLSQCYCTSEDTIKGGALITAALADPLPHFRKPVQPVKPGHRKDPFNKTISGVVAAPPNDPLIVLMGGPGVGKTTFLEWYFQVNAPSTIKQQACIVKLDYRKLDIAAASVKQDAIRTAISKLEVVEAEHLTSFGQLKAIFAEELKREQLGALAPWASDTIELEKQLSQVISRLRDGRVGHLGKLASYLRHKVGKQVIIVIDNIDHLDDNQQLELFHVAQHIVFEAKCVAVIALRESTYYRLLRSPEINAFSQLEFHVRGQRLTDVLQRRFAYLQHELAEIDEETFSGSYGKAITIDDMSKFVDLLGGSLLDAAAESKCAVCIESLSNGNMRQQLGMIHTFLMSGQTKIDEYFWSYTQSKRKKIQYHELLHSLIHEDHKVYCEGDNQNFINIFEPGPECRASHLTHLRILSYFASLGQRGELRNADYIALESIAAAVEPLGLDLGAVSWYVSRLKHYGLLTTPSQTVGGGVSAEPLALSRCGVYYLEHLYCDPTYVMAIAPDTSVFDASCATKIAKALQQGVVAEKVPIYNRLLIADILVAYLEDQERAERASSVLEHHPLFGRWRYVQRMRDGIEEVARQAKLLGR